MPDIYFIVGMMLSVGVVFVGRSTVIRLRRKGDMESTIPVSIMTVFAALFTILVWPVVPAVLALMWALGFCTIPEIKAFFRKHLRSRND